MSRQATSEKVLPGMRLGLTLTSCLHAVYHLVACSNVLRQPIIIVQHARGFCTIVLCSILTVIIVVILQLEEELGFGNYNLA